MSMYELYGSSIPPNAHILLKSIDTIHGANKTTPRATPTRPQILPDITQHHGQLYLLPTQEAHPLCTMRGLPDCRSHACAHFTIIWKWPGSETRRKVLLRKPNSPIDTHNGQETLLVKIELQRNAQRRRVLLKAWRKRARHGNGMNMFQLRGRRICRWHAVTAGRGRLVLCIWAITRC